MKFLLLMLMGSILVEAQSQPCDLERLHGRLKEAAACYDALTRSSDAFSRAQGYLGLRRYDEANTEFREADQRHPNSAQIKTAWGRLYAEHAQPGDAAQLFEEAMKADPKYAPAYLELARVLAESFDERAVQLANQALQLDPTLYKAHELLAYLALEDSDPKLATEEAQKALAQSSEALDALSVLASIDWLNGASFSGNTQSPWIDRVLKVNPLYGEAYSTGAHFLAINYRYDEAIAFYRKALELNPSLWPARSQLGLNLMRLGFNDEARRQLVQCYDAHFRDPETLNGLRFLDKLNDFELVNGGNADVLLSKAEAPLLAPYVVPELQRAMDTYEHKYRMKLPGRVRLEIYPNNADFLVRTIGLPAQVGLLGVTFGTVVAIESPSASPPGEYNWADTMWHEMSHVYVVTATHHLVPRWFTEGLAVHEEHAASPQWGDRLTPDIVVAIRDKKLLPLADLDRGFVRPQYPGEVLVAYYQAGRICDFIAEKWGDAAIVGMIHSFASRKTTSQAIGDNLHLDPTAFDNAFKQWLASKTGPVVQHFDTWQKGVRTAYREFEAKDTEAALRAASGVRDDYPDYVGKNSVYEVLAEIWESKGDRAQAAGQLERYRDMGGTNLASLKSLVDLEKTLARTEQEKQTLESMNNIYPEDEFIHQALGGLMLGSGDPNEAVNEFRAVLALRPAAIAESHFNLAKALNAAHRTKDAKDEVLLALEAAPDYKPAQHLLLELSQ